MEPIPDLGALSDDDLERLIDELTEEGVDAGPRKARVDLLRAELKARLEATGGRSVLEEPEAPNDGGPA